MNFRDILLSLLIALCWGFNYLAVKESTADFGAMTALFLRYVLVILILIPTIIKIPRSLYMPIFKVAMVFGIGYFGLFFYAANAVSASLASVILQLQIPFTLILSVLLLKEEVPLISWLGVILAFIGVLFAIGKISWMGALFADGLLVLAAALWAYFNIMVRQLKLRVDPMALNAGIALFSAPFFLICMFISEPHLLKHMAHAGIISWASIFYMSVISTIFCYYHWFKLIHRNGVAIITPFSMLATVFAIIFGHLLMKDALTPHLILGTGLTLGGIGLIVLPKSLKALHRRFRRQPS